MKNDKFYFGNFILISIGVFFFIPFLILIINSFGTLGEYPNLYLLKFNLDSWKYVFKSELMSDIIQTLNVGILSLILLTVISYPAAYIMVRASFKGKKIIDAIFMLPIMISPIGIATGVYQAFLKFGISDTLFGVVLGVSFPAYPYVYRSMKIGIEALEYAWEEQISLLGISWINSFILIIPRMIIPSILGGWSIGFLVAISQYAVVLILGGGNVMTLLVRMMPYLNGGTESIACVYGIIFMCFSMGILWYMDYFLKKYYHGEI